MISSETAFVTPSQGYAPILALKYKTRVDSNDSKAYYIIELIMTIKSFMIQAPRSKSRGTSTLSMSTFSGMTLSITIKSNATLSILEHDTECCYAEFHLN